MSRSTIRTGCLVAVAGEVLLDAGEVEADFRVGVERELRHAAELLYRGGSGHRVGMRRCGIEAPAVAVGQPQFLALVMMTSCQVPDEKCERNASARLAAAKISRKYRAKNRRCRDFFGFDPSCDEFLKPSAT
jgi:hypothetical protein